MTEALALQEADWVQSLATHMIEISKFTRGEIEFFWKLVKYYSLIPNESKEETLVEMFKDLKINRSRNTLSKQ